MPIWIAVAALGYVGVVGVLYTGQTSMVFPGASMTTVPIDAPRAPERLTLTTVDGDQIHGQLFRADGAGADLLLGFGGNAQDVEYLGQDLAADFPDLNVVVFHYRGYGPSEGTPSEAALFADAGLIFDTMTAALEPARSFAIGLSLGSGVAAYLSTARDLAGVLLVTPFDSIEAIAKDSYFWVPVGLLLHHKFPSDALMADNPTPTAVIAAEHDQVVKPARTRALIALVENLVFERVIAGADHGSLYGTPAYEQALDDGLAALRAASAASDQPPR